MEYNYIEFYNSCDLGQYLYQHGFRQRFYFEQDLGVPEHTKEEEGTTDGDGQFIPSFQKIKKTYIIDLGLVPEYACDALQLMQIHDTKRIYLKDGSSAEMLDVSVESEWVGTGCFSHVKVKFSCDFISKTACCSNRTECISPDVDVIDIIQDTDAIYTDPAGEGISVGSRYFVWSTQSPDGKYEGSVYQYTGQTVKWAELTQYNSEGYTVYKVPATSVYLYFDGTYWWQYPLVNNYSVSGDDITMLGFAPPDTLVYILLDVDGVETTSDTYTSNTYNVSGITFPDAIAGGWTTITAKITCFTHSCSYGTTEMVFTSGA